MTHLFMSYGIKNKFLNPIMGVELTQPQVLTLFVVGWVGLVLVLKMYCLMLLEIDLLTKYY